jgi:hypothetical protein
LHKFAKEVLARDCKLVLTALELENGTDSWVGYSGGWFRFDAAAIEQRLGDLVPDVIVRRGDRDLLVEFAVTHPCDAAKITKIIDADLSAIEIDLSGLSPGWSRKHLETAILAKAPRRWLHNPKLRDGEAVLEERRRERERAFAQRVASLSNDYDVAAARMGSDAPRLRVSSRLVELGLAQAVGINVDGVGCFFVCPQEWQSAIILDAVKRAAPGTLPFISEYRALETVRRRGWLRSEFSALTKAEVAAIRAHGTAFARPEDAILSWVTALVRTGMLRAHKFGWTVWTETLETVSETARESLRRRELPNLRLKYLRGIVANVLRNASEQEVASFSFDRWVRQELPGRVVLLSRPFIQTSCSTVSLATCTSC